MVCRIVYITINELIDPTKGGVSNKLLTKVAAVNRQCGFCRLINVRKNASNDQLNEIVINDLVTEIEIGLKGNEWDKNDVVFYSRLSSYLELKFVNVVRLIMRYPYASMGLLYMSRRFYKKIIFEHNTKEIEEIRLEIKRKEFAAFSIRPSGFKFWYREKLMPIINERLLAPKIFANAYAGACVTTEIAAYESKRDKKYKTFVSSNFYDVKETICTLKSYNHENEKLVLGMLVTTVSSWYGLERLLRSFAPYQRQFELIIGGLEASNPEIQRIITRYEITSGLQIAGRLSKKELKGFYKRVHICFGSLGLHIINLRFASTLKVKESISHGVPVAIGYLEEDFYANPEFEPFYLQLPNDDSLVNFELLRQFAIRFYSDPQNQLTLRELALKYIDVDVKVHELLKNVS